MSREERERLRAQVSEIKRMEASGEITRARSREMQVDALREFANRRRSPDDILRSEVIREMTSSEKRLRLGANMARLGSSLTPLGMITGWGRKDGEKWDAEIKRRVDIKKAALAQDNLSRAIESTYHKPRQPTNRYCPNCGSSHTPQARFCPSCGTCF
ncbi:MAG TPA: zinc ribbon domain-containing protein [Candidatus Acidoferrales bacterium]|nr:zinc ribbon domain-containing protein [Candidatus Acidoferrales bacterium]